MASPMSAPTHKYNFALQKYILLQEQHQELVAHLDQIRPTPSSSLLLQTSSTFPATSPSISPSRSSSISSNSSSTGSVVAVPLSYPSTTAAAATASGRRHTRRSRTLQPDDGAGQQTCHLLRSDTLETITDEETLFEISAEERRLFDVNESMKRALTELLNCEAVRADNNMRMWVQGRLMETEQELRSGRRRKNSTD